MSAGRLQKLSSASYRRIYSAVPRLCADVVIRASGGVLLTRRSIPPWRGWWHLPGGRVHKFETLSRAAERICREELGVKVRVSKVLGAVEYLRDRTAPGFVTHSVSVVLAARLIGGMPRGSWQAREISFFRSLPRKVIPGVGRFLRSHSLIKR
ncbi:MAG: NUDIX domain-containing protein [Candidatus Sungbacteria bacterium]|uniref:NUDIX domain-containing protein n=1 Tax=Candidatus Sungiibacteriota bacterium TaxID=2750080 RepID=A0A932YWT5_9BACT|nr:NUDIX domain-containing protein [Candidatus Sungbacteria bacterium]